MDMIADGIIDDKRYRVVELDWRDVGYPESNSVAIMLYAQELDD